MDRILDRGVGVMLSALSIAILVGPAPVAAAQTVPVPVPTTRSTGPASRTALRPFRPPTTRPVSRGFDMSNGPYGAGNRGLDYAVQHGDTIRAIGGGTIVFAGAVAGERFVTVLHPDGLRSSYSYLVTISVSLGSRASLGDVIGSSSGRFQLGIRRGSDYIDPAGLLGRDGPPTRARLVRGPRV